MLYINHAHSRMGRYVIHLVSRPAGRPGCRTTAHPGPPAEPLDPILVLRPDRAGRGLPGPAKAMGGFGLVNDFASVRAICSFFAGRSGPALIEQPPCQIRHSHKKPCKTEGFRAFASIGLGRSTPEVLQSRSFDPHRDTCRYLPCAPAHAHPHPSPHHKPLCPATNDAYIRQTARTGVRAAAKDAISENRDVYNTRSSGSITGNSASSTGKSSGAQLSMFNRATGR